MKIWVRVPKDSFCLVVTLPFFLFIEEENKQEEGAKKDKV